MGPWGSGFPRGSGKKLSTSPAHPTGAAYLPPFLPPPPFFGAAWLSALAAADFSALGGVKKLPAPRTPSEISWDEELTEAE